MSFRAVTWAFDTIRGLGATEKLVLLALAEFANDADMTWRSQAEIAKRAECSERSVKRHVQALEDRGLIERRGMYRWCESPSCSADGMHKHRSGTTYLLRLDVTEPLPLVDRGAPVDNSEIPISAKLAPMGESAENQGKTHKCQIGTYGPTGAKLGDPQVPRVAPVLKVNPQLNPQPNQTKPKPKESPGDGSGLVGDDYSSLDKNGPPPACPSPGRDGPSSDGEVAAVAALVSECLPKPLWSLDRAGMVRVGDLLRDRLDAGWTPKQIRALMDQELPSTVGRLSALVAHRLKVNVDPVLAPAALENTKRHAAPPSQKAVEPVDAAEDVWTRLVWGPRWNKFRQQSHGISPMEIINQTATSLLTDGINETEFKTSFTRLKAQSPEVDDETIVRQILGGVVL